MKVVSFKALVKIPNNTLFLIKLSDFALQTKG